VPAAELASIFVVFTSHAWQMMMSMFGGWFFGIASEAISVADKIIRRCLDRH
jgi:ABC-type anion transport system duplicated permease subunit